MFIFVSFDLCLPKNAQKIALAYLFCFAPSVRIYCKVLVSFALMVVRIQITEAETGPPSFLKFLLFVSIIGNKLGN